jgi:peptide/nickel transport system substrate-binding protein
MSQQSRTTAGGLRHVAAAAAVTLLFLALALAWLKSPSRPPGPPVAEASQEAAGGGAEFTPPSAEELAKVRWIRQPVVDFLEKMRAELERTPPLATETEALALVNDGPEDNARILSAFGRLPASPEEVDWDATCLRSMMGEPSTLNPVLQQANRYEQWLFRLIGAAPIDYDATLKPYGNLEVIERWEVSEDRLMDRIVLRSDLRWSDGAPLTAGDFEFTFERILDPRVRVPTLRSLLGSLKALKAYDDRTLVYFHEDGRATNHLHLAWIPLPRHRFAPLLDKDPSLTQSPEAQALNLQSPVTCGPYRLVAWAKSREIVLERNDFWHQSAAGEVVRHKPFFRRVIFRIRPDNASRFLALQKGEIEEMELDSEQWVELSQASWFHKQNTKITAEQWQYAFIGWNQKSVPPNPFFADRRVRLAMTYAFDHDHCLKSLFFGLYRPGAGIFHPDSPFAAKGLEPFRQDLDRAEELLDEAGWVDGDGDGIRDKLIDGRRVPFRFTLAVPAAGTGDKVGAILQSSLAKIGVRCDIQLMEPAQFFESCLNHKVQAFVLAWGVGVDPDPIRNIWKSEEYEKGGRNYVGYSNPRVDELIEMGALEHDPEKRAGIYAEIDRLIYEDHAYTILFYRPTLFAFNKSLRGVQCSPRGVFNHQPGFLSLWKKKAAR